jgi:hypothetical protein
MVTWGIALIALCVCAALLLGTYRASPARVSTVATGVLTWLSVTAALGMSGVLTHFEARPPPFALVLVGTAVAGIGVGLSPLGGALSRGVPLWALIAAQGFRLPLELVMHRAATEGTMPVEMSYSGYNFDIVTGASSLLVAFALTRGAPIWLAQAWNLMGAGLLAVVVSVAVLGSPLFRAFGGGAHVNTWVAYFPFVWLPSILVAAALAGHIVVFRALRDVRRVLPAPAPSTG